MANATQRKQRRGTTQEHSTFIGAIGEITVDITKKTAVIHDGETAGGTPLAKEIHTHLANNITNLGTSALFNVGTNPNNIVQLNNVGKLPPLDGSLLFNLSYAAVSHQHSLVDINGLGSSATLDAGVGAGNVVILDQDGMLPAVNASKLINVPVSPHIHTLNQISNIGTAANHNVGTLPGNVVQLDQDSKLPAVNASQLLNVPVSSHTHTFIDVNGLGTGAALSAGTNPFNLIQIDYAGKLPAVDASQLLNVPVSPHTHSLSDVSGVGTVVGYNVGIGSNNIVQLDENAKLPAVDGSRLYDVRIPRLYNGYTTLDCMENANWKFLTSNQTTLLSWNVQSDNNVIKFNAQPPATKHEWFWNFITDDGSSTGGIIIGNPDNTITRKTSIMAANKNNLYIGAGESSDILPGLLIISGGNNTSSSPGASVILKGGSTLGTDPGKVYYSSNGTENVGQDDEVAVIGKTMAVDNISGVAKLPQLSEDPVVSDAGSIYWNNTLNTVRVFNGTDWISMF
jgi:hypothetical protein